MNVIPRAPLDLPTDLKTLIASGYRARTVKVEIKENLLSKLRDAQVTLPGIVGFEDTVGPAVERALSAQGGDHLVSTGR